MTNNNIQKISVDLIDDPAFAMRSNIPEDAIEELATSIKELGLINPISVKQVGERYEVIAGHRRLLATRRAGLIFIDCVVRDISDADTLTMTASENLVRQDVNPVDEAVFLGRLLSEKQMSVEAIAKMLHRSIDWVDQRLAMLEWPERVLLHIANKDISIGAAGELMKIKDEPTRDNFIEIAAKDGLTIERARAWVSMYGVGQITAETTPEQLKAMEQPEQHNETMITCAKCGQPAKISDMLTVWIHKECPETAA